MSRQDEEPLMGEYLSKVTNKKDDSIHNVNASSSISKLKTLSIATNEKQSTFATLFSVFVSIPSLIGA